MAQQGGIGIVHKNLTPVEQAREVAKVKRFESGVLRDPITVAPHMTVREIIELSQQHGISGFPVVDGAALIGIVTNRDLRFETRLDEPVRTIMTPRERLITVKEARRSPRPRRSCITTGSSAWSSSTTRSNCAV